MSNELKIDKARVLAEAEKCPTFKNIAKELWPEVFEDEHFNFGDNFELVSTRYNGPFMIGDGMAPKGLVKKCLIVSPDWDILFDRIDGNTILIPTRKP